MKMQNTPKRESPKLSKIVPRPVRGEPSQIALKLGVEVMKAKLATAVKAAKPKPAKVAKTAKRAKAAKPKKPPRVRTPSERGKHSRNKGSSFEREMANEFKKVYPGARRGIGQARSAKEVSDVDGTPWWVECKVGKRTNIPAAFDQATEATDGRDIIVVSHNDGGFNFVTMTLAVFLKLAAQLQTIKAP